MSVKQLSDDERARRRAAEGEQAVKAVEALRSTSGWQAWLGARRHFHKYSFANQLLIALQCPGATHVAGFRAWLKLGYAVRKGERAIRIWVKRAISHPMQGGIVAASVLRSGLLWTGGSEPLAEFVRCLRDETNTVIASLR